MNGKQVKKLRKYANRYATDYINKMFKPKPKWVPLWLWTKIINFVIYK